MDGYAVAAKIREDQDLKNVYLVALSGYARSEDIEKAQAYGFDRHLGKPVDLDTLQNILNECK
jgi:CheY-like chemotaxis protein